MGSVKINRICGVVNIFPIQNFNNHGHGLVRPFLQFQVCEVVVEMIEHQAVQIGMLDRKKYVLMTQGTNSFQFI